MAFQVIHTDRAPAAVGPYSQAVRAGNLLITSGQLGLDPSTGVLPEGVEKQTRQSLENIGAILAEAGFSRTDVVKTTVFIRNMDDFARVNGIYGKRITQTRSSIILHSKTLASYKGASVCRTVCHMQAICCANPQ